MISRYKSK